MTDTVQADKSLSQEALARTVQTVPHATPETLGMGDYGDTWTLYLAHEADDMPRWGTRWQERDRLMRELVPLEPTLAGALTTIAARNATMSFTLDGPARTVAAAQDMLHASDQGAGLVSLMTKLSLDLYTQDNGAFLEVARQEYMTGEAALKAWTAGKPLPAVAGLNHLDAAACTRTGDPLYPVMFVDPDDPTQTRHLLPWHMVCPIAEMPSPVKRQRGRQYSALTRILEAARFMRDVTIYRRERVSGRDPSEMHFVGNVSPKFLDDAKKLHQERASNQGLLRYIEPYIIAGLAADRPVSTASIALKNLPDGFAYDQELRDYITLLALCLGEDYLTFAPLPGGNQGTATQSVMLERKSRGKGPAMWQKIVTHLMNFYGILPRTVEFGFEERDITHEQEEAALASTHVATLAAAVTAGLISVPVAQQWMADNGVILDEEYLAMLGEEDATPDETVTDDAPVADTGDIEELPADGTPPAETPPGEQPAQPPPQQAARGGAARGSFFRKAIGAAWVAVRRATLRYYKAGGATGDIDTIVSDFAAATEDALEGYMAGTYGRARAQRVFEAAIREAWLPAAEAGYTDGGGEKDDLGADDYADIRDAERAQVEYARDFWAALPEVRKADGDPLPRGELYAASLRAFYTEWKARGDSNRVLEWRVGDTEHCDVCAALDGTRHKISWYVERDYIPRKPGAAMTCGGYKCQCGWYDTKGQEYTL